MSFRDPSAPDVVIEHSGTAIGYKLAENEQGVRQWYPAFVPQNVPEQATGAFSYDDRPKAVSQPLVFEDWSGGCGVVDEVPGTTRTNYYSYSQGVDASWGQPCLSPKFTAFSGMTEAPTRFYRAPTNGWYALSATKVWRLAAGEWVSVYTAAAAPTDIIEYQNTVNTYLFLALGDSTDFIYTTSATFASTTTVTSEKASYFAVRGSNSMEPVLFATKATGTTRSSTNPIATGNWSNEDQIGRRNETVRGLVVANDLLWYLKEEAVYTFDGTNIGTLVNADMLKRTNNGAKNAVYFDRNIYANYGNRILKIDTVDETVETFFGIDHPELNGTITALALDLRDAYIFVQNAAGNTYVIKKPILGGPPHTIAYLSGVTVNAAMIIPADSASPSSTNPVLAIGYGSASRYAILPRDGYRPWEDTNYRYDIAGGTVYGPWVDAGAATYEKWLNAGRVVAKGATGALSVGVSYGLDGNDSVTALVTAVADGLTTERVTTDVTFTRIRYAATLSTGSALDTARLVAIVFDTTPNPPRHRQWTLMLDVGDRQSAFGVGGAARPFSYDRALKHLLGAIEKRITYTDYFGTTYSAKVDNVAPQGVAAVGTATGRSNAKSLVQISVTEIAENLTITSPFIWGATSTAAGGTPWSSGYQWTE